MFQYAAAGALAERHGTELVLDTSWWSTTAAAGGVARHTELDFFDLDVRVCPRLGGRAASATLATRLRAAARSARAAGSSCTTIGEELDDGLRATRPDARRTRPTSSATGSSRTYFADSEALIRKAFTFPAARGTERGVAERDPCDDGLGVDPRPPGRLRARAGRTMIGFLDAAYYARAIEAVAARRRRAPLLRLLGRPGVVPREPVASAHPDDDRRPTAAPASGRGRTCA